MSDKNSGSDWSLLDPTAWQRQRMERRVFNWLAARETSLLAEWLSFLNRSPIAAVGLTAASALSLALVTPIGWLSVLLAS